jgi:small subunit ribosomal protein S21
MEVARGRDGGSALVTVIVSPHESVDSALKRFKRKVQEEDIMKEIKKHSVYMKPGERRRAKEALARKRLRRRLRRMKQLSKRTS